MSSKADPLGKRRSPKAGSAKARKRGGPRTMQQVALTWEVNGLIAGVDEAGRGPLAGPVVAAAVILDDLHPIKGLADSKKLTALQRDRLYDEIRGKALCYAVAQASVQEIDELNILQATLLAMRRAVLGLRLFPNWFWWMATGCQCCQCVLRPSSKGTTRWRPSLRLPSWPK